MALKNYTSTVPASRSISYIEAKLVKHGARHILKTYEVDGRINALCFSVVFDGKEIPFKLPARVAQCEQILRADLSPRCKPETRKKVPEQAERTAWKILADWVDAQMAMIELAQVELLEVFLPYVFDGSKNQTYFEVLKDNKFKALPAAISEGV